MVGRGPVIGCGWLPAAFSFNADPPSIDFQGNEYEGWGCSEEERSEDTFAGDWAHFAESSHIRA